MKKNVPVLMLSVLLIPFVSHAEGPIDGKVYGKINASYLSTDNAGTSDSYLESNASRLGFKGKTEVNKGMSVVYQLEYEVDPTEKAASATIFKTRNSFIGLGSTAGTFLMGFHDTPLKLAQGKTDLFNDLAGGDIKNLVRGEVRSGDVFAYLSPDLGGLTLMAATTQYEDSQSQNDGSSFSVAYKGIENLYLSFAVDDDIAGYDTTRVVVQYKIAALVVGALFNSSEATGGSTSEDSTVISASYKINNWKLKAQYGFGDEKLGKGGEQVSLGVDYKLSKESKLYVYSSSLSNDANTVDKRYTGLGIEHKF